MACEHILLNCGKCTAERSSLAAEVERLLVENATYKQFSAVHDQAEHDAFMRGREVAFEYLQDERDRLLTERDQLRARLAVVEPVFAAAKAWAAAPAGDRPTMDALLDALYDATPHDATTGEKP